MLFLSDSIIDAKQRLMPKAIKDPERSVSSLQQILELDPRDHTALVLLAQARVAAGDAAEAEGLLWRAAEAQPCAWAPFMELSLVVGEQSPLFKGLCELAWRKILLDEAALELMEKEPPPGLKDFPELEDASTLEKLQLMAASYREDRDLEPVAVTARLRPHRLIQQLLDGDSVERELVTTLIEEGEAMVPLLTGVLRGWVQSLIPDDDVFVVECSLAILGEIGDVQSIPALLELADVDDADVSGPAGWALDRIVAKHPGEATRLMRERAPQLGGGERLSVVERIMRAPKIDPEGALIEGLFEGFDRVEKDGRDICFRMLASALIILWGRQGLENARKMLRRHGSLLSRSGRRECEEMIQEYGALPPREPPAVDPSPWTVYQICDGEVDWEAELESEEEQDEEEYFPSEPLRRHAVPGRNEPCWCGSGKKYKKCHLEADEEGNRESPGSRDDGEEMPKDDFDGLRQKVGELLRKLPESESRQSIEEFFGGEPGLEQEMGPLALIDWMVHDRVSKSFGRTVLEEYLHRNGARLTERERAFLESSARSYVDLFEVCETDPGNGLEVKSLTSGETHFVHETGMSKKLSKWDGLLTRMIEGERGLGFTGPGTQVPRDHLQSLQAWMEGDKRKSRLSWPEYLKRNWPRVRRQNEEIAAQWMESVQLQNGDGEELVMSKAYYRVVNRGALIAALRSAIDIDEAEEGTSFVWLSGPASETGHTVLGDIRVVGGDLTLEGNSRQRLKRGKKMLVNLAGPALEFREEEFETQEELKRSLKEERPRAKSPEDAIPPEVERQVVGEYMEQHYAKWPDMKLPALDGKTPRQAAKNAAGKRKVAELLKQLENSEDRKRKEGKYAYDVSKLRRELGIKG